MPHPTENPNAGVPEPTVPTPRPENAPKAEDPNRYDWRGELVEEKAQAEIRRRTEKDSDESPRVAEDEEPQGN